MSALSDLFMRDTKASALSDLFTRRFAGLMSGKMQLTDFPEYMAAEERLRRMGALGRMGMGRQLTAAGVKGPALATTLQQAQESQMAPMGSLLSSIPDKAMGWAQHLDQMGLANRQLQLQKLLGLGELREARKGRQASQSGVNLGILGRWGS